MRRGVLCRRQDNRRRCGRSSQAERWGPSTPAHATPPPPPRAPDAAWTCSCGIPAPNTAVGKAGPRRRCTAPRRYPPWAPRICTHLRRAQGGRRDEGRRQMAMGRNWCTSGGGARVRSGCEMRQSEGAAKGQPTRPNALSHGRADVATSGDAMFLSRSPTKTIKKTRDLPHLQCICERLEGVPTPSSLAAPIRTKVAAGDGDAIRCRPQTVRCIPKYWAPWSEGAGLDPTPPTPPTAALDHPPPPPSLGGPGPLVRGRGTRWCPMGLGPGGGWPVGECSRCSPSPNAATPGAQCLETRTIDGGP